MTTITVFTHVHALLSGFKGWLVIWLDGRTVGRSGSRAVGRSGGRAVGRTNVHFYALHEILGLAQARPNYLYVVYGS